MVLHNDSIIFCGGVYSYINKDCFKFSNKTLKIHNTLNRHRVNTPAVSIKSGTFVFGGLYNPYSYEYLPKDSTTWILGNNDIPGGIRDACAISINSDKEILLIGGANIKFGRRILKFNVKDHTFEKMPVELIFERSGHRCAFIPGTKKIMITGGYRYTNGVDQSSTTEILDIENGSITLANPMNIGRAHHGIGVITINDENRVTVFGGKNGQNGGLDSVETFNTKTQKWEMSDIKLSQERYGFGFLSVKHEYLSKINS